MYPALGFGATANCFLDLVNVEEGDPKNMVPNNLHRSKDPGVGAFSTYQDRVSTAKVRIRKGQELFVNYGECNPENISFVHIICG